MLCRTRTWGVLSFVLVAVLCVALGGCGGQGNPEATVQAMMDAAAANDTKGFLDCLEPSSRAVMAELMAVMGEEQAQLAIAQRPNASVTIQSSQVEGERATVTVIGIDGKKNEVPLALVDGKWKVEIREFAGMSAAEREKVFEEARQMRKMMDQAAKMGQGSGGVPGQAPATEGGKE